LLTVNTAHHDFHDVSILENLLHIGSRNVPTHLRAVQETDNTFADFDEGSKFNDVENLTGYISFVIVIDALLIRIGITGLTDAGTDFFNTIHVRDANLDLLPRIVVAGSRIQTPREFLLRYHRIQFVVCHIDKQAPIVDLDYDGVVHIAYGKLAIGFFDKLNVRHQDLCVFDRTHIHLHFLPKYLVGGVALLVVRQGVGKESVSSEDRNGITAFLAG